jgi:putative phosphoesterase
MKIGVVSDTHGKSVLLHRALEKLGKMDVLIHLGDHCSDAADLEQSLNFPVVYVKGNCDFYANVPDALNLTFGGKKFYIVHGHQFQVNYSLDRLIYKGLEVDADVVLYGHTHIPQVYYEGNLLVLNPGSTACPRSGKKKTAAMIHIVEGKLIPNIITLEE